MDNTNNWSYRGIGLERRVRNAIHIYDAVEPELAQYLDRCLQKWEKLKPCFIPADLPTFEEETIGDVWQKR